MSHRFPKSTRSAHRKHVHQPSSRSALSTSFDTWLDGHHMFSPLGFEPGYDYPLLVWLPDDSMSHPFNLGRVMARMNLRNYVAVRPAIECVHDTDLLESSMWNAIDTVKERVFIHRERIFLIGSGEGGAAALRIACRHPNVFGGVISLDGFFPLDEGLFAQLKEIRRLPMLLCCQNSNSPGAACHADKTLRLFHAAGAAMSMRIYADCNQLSKSVLRDVNRWIMEEVCEPSFTMRSTCRQ
ncbi:MAG: hypothetical protein ABGW78_09125 [Pirellulales bacterium]